jgi:hypothetical protein
VALLPSARGKSDVNCTELTLPLHLLTFFRIVRLLCETGDYLLTEEYTFTSVRRTETLLRPQASPPKLSLGANISFS